MDRVLIYPGQIPLETDLLGTNKNTMIGLSKLAAAILGTSTQLNGLACNANSPAALNVVVSPGEIYSLQNIDGTAYSSIAADTTHSILKQGILLDAVTLSCPAPVTAGQSINYLVQVTYTDSDTTPVVLPYYNASNPSQAYSGPANAGTTNNTIRKGVCTVAVKAGIAATTGTQTTPSADAGYTGAYVVTVANGQTTIVAGNISTLVGAPFINTTLLGLNPTFSVSPLAPTPSQFDNSTKMATTAGVKTAGIQASGITTITTSAAIGLTAIGGTVVLNSASAIAPTLPAASAVPAGGRIEFWSGNTGIATLTRAGSDTINVNGSTVTTIALGAGDTLTLESNGASGWYAVAGTAQIQYSSAVVGRLLNVQIFTSSGAYTPTPGTNSVVAEAQGGGGAGGGAGASSASQTSNAPGGNAGSYGKGRYTSSFSGVTVTVGAGGTGSAGAAGGNGGTSSFGVLLSAPGGTGGTAYTTLSTAATNINGTAAQSASTGGNIVNSVGGRGQPALSSQVAYGGSGDGGKSAFGEGAPGKGIPVSGALAGNNAVSPGAGGSGGLSSNGSAAAAGGNGANGIVIVWEYA